MAPQFDYSANRTISGETSYRQVSFFYIISYMDSSISSANNRENYLVFSLWNLKNGEELKLGFGISSWGRTLRMMKMEHRDRSDRAGNVSQHTWQLYRVQWHTLATSFTGMIRFTQFEMDNMSFLFAWPGVGAHVYPFADSVVKHEGCLSFHAIVEDRNSLIRKLVEAFVYCNGICNYLW